MFLRKIYNKEYTIKHIIYSILGLKIKIKNKNKDILEILNNWESEIPPHLIQDKIEKKLSEDVFHYNEISLIYISMLLEQKKDEDAKKWLYKHIDIFGLKNIEKFYLVSKFSLSLNIKNTLLKKTAETIDALIEEDMSFKKYIENKSITIVGNSPCAIGKKQGYKIDSSDITIRFNNYKTEGFEYDYGDKTDIWCVCQADDIQKKSIKELKKITYLLLNANITRNKINNYTLSLIDEVRKENIKCALLDYSLKKEVSERANVKHPSSGLTAIYYFYKMYNIKKENIFAFSFLQEGASPYAHYFRKRSNRKQKKFQKNAYHDFDSENIFLKHLFNKNF